VLGQQPVNRWQAAGLGGVVTGRTCGLRSGDWPRGSARSMTTWARGGVACRDDGLLPDFYQRHGVGQPCSFLTWEFVLARCGMCALAEIEPHRLTFLLWLR
jgi:hypothetical protein